MRARFRKFAHSYRLAILAGGIIALPLSKSAGGGLFSHLIALVASIFFGALFGIVILTVIRFFKTARWGYPIAGLFAGSVPLLVIPLKGKDLAGLWLVSAFLGVLIGLLEWENTSRLARTVSEPEAEED